jgi:hypothetical protein
MLAGHNKNHLAVSEFMFSRENKDMIGNVGISYCDY